MAGLKGWSKITNVNGTTLSTKLKKYGKQYLESFISKNIQI